MNATRHELIQLLSELSDQYPTLRFGQLVEAVTMWSSQTRLNGVGEVSDEELIQAAKDHLHQIHSPASTAQIT